MGRSNDPPLALPSLVRCGTLGTRACLLRPRRLQRGDDRLAVIAHDIRGVAVSDIPIWGVTTRLRVL